MKAYTVPSLIQKQKQYAKKSEQIIRNTAINKDLNDLDSVKSDDD